MTWLEADAGPRRSAKPDTTVEQRHQTIRSLTLAALALRDAFATAAGEPPG